MNNNTTELKGREFNSLRYPKIKRIITTPRKKIRQNLRSFLPLNLEKFAETLPMSQPISRRNTGLNPTL
ncbi:hypothetical protein [Pedobacter nyackensis]|uniref:hypothetical protein n=1 Tax=Pedobacter nyackensis TaxID=475255 RepID=UPI000A03C7B7|nr:hypothetical protein [Pedobacter nyackensis]